MQHKKSLQRSIEVTSQARPIKVAYIVPFDETEHNHWIIDAVFCDSYARWGGVRTLLIPSDKDKFLNPDYEAWLAFFDADIVYTYVDLNDEMISKIDILCHPIVFLKHENKKAVERWRDLLPRYELYMKPVSSITTVSAMPWMRDLTGNPIRTILTQQVEIPQERFIADNFGTGQLLYNYTNPVRGLFETFSFSHEDNENNSNRLANVVSRITEKNTLTFSQLAVAHSENLAKMASNVWGNNLNIFIGTGCLDRIHFWNSRHFCEASHSTLGSLIIRHELLSDQDFLSAFGKYIDRNNYMDGSGNHKINLRSFSISEKELEDAGNILKKNTKYQYYTHQDLSLNPVPSLENIKHSYNNSSKDKVSFKINEASKIFSPDPSHFSFIPAQYYSLNAGQWAVEVAVERHNSLSQVVNVTDVWLLPRRINATRCFTKNLSRVSKNNLLLVIPDRETSYLHSVHPGDKDKSCYHLSLPDDETFFRCLLIDDRHMRDEADLRSRVKFDYYKDVCISDKGQNLRGVVSMFDELNQAYKCLTNKFWREVIKSYYHDTTARAELETGEEKVRIVHFDKVKTKDEIYGMLKVVNEYKKRLASQLRIDEKSVSEYIRSNFDDSLELLVKYEIFYQVHKWRCRHCGNSNIRNLDKLKLKNKCNPCKRTYFTPIDVSWYFQLNPFLLNTLVVRSGLTVLWILGLLHDDYTGRNFYYLPEVNLVPDDKKPHLTEEIDLLCVLHGLLYAVEAKKSASSFMRDNVVDAFIKKIEKIRPDVALLAFEQYSEDGNNVDEVKAALKKVAQKIKQCKVPNLSVKIEVATDHQSFNEYPVDLFYWGKRTTELLYPPNAE